MTLSSQTASFESVKQYLATRHVHSTDEWIREQLSSLSSSSPNESMESEIYRRILEQDWNCASGSMRPVLPPELSISSLNREPLKHFGTYLLQIDEMIDISRPLIANAEIDDVADDESGEEVYDDDDQDSADDENRRKESRELAQLFKKKKTTAKNVGKKNGKKCSKNGDNFTFSGSRCFSLRLTDGRQRCVAIEYAPVRELTADMITSKILIKGPFEICAGIIFLTAKNCSIVWRGNVSNCVTTTTTATTNNFTATNTTTATATNITLATTTTTTTTTTNTGICAVAEEESMAMIMDEFDQDEIYEMPAARQNQPSETAISNDEIEQLLIDDFDDSLIY